MKIVFLSHLDLNLYLFRLPIMKKLLEKNVEVIALVPKGDFCHLLQKEGIKVINYNFKRGSVNIFNILKTINELKEILIELSPDIVHTFTHQPNIYGTIAAKKAGVKNIINLVEGMGTFFIEDSLFAKIIRNIIKTLYKQTFKYAKKVIFVNSDDPSYFINQNIIDESKVEIIKSVGIDTNEWKNKDLGFRVEDLGISNNKPIVLMIARVIKDKGVEEYIKAADKLKDKANFLYVGDMYKGNKNAFVPNWGSVKYLGFRRDIKELISACDIFVLPSYREGVPRTLLEAASMAKPIVTTDAVGCKEVVEDNKNGFLVPVKDGEKLAKAIEILIYNPKLREKFGKNGRIKAINEFDIKVVVEKYMKVYKELEC